MRPTSWRTSHATRRLTWTTPVPPAREAATRRPPRQGASRTGARTRPTSTAQRSRKTPEPPGVGKSAWAGDGRCRVPRTPQWSLRPTPRDRSSVPHLRASGDPDAGPAPAASRGACGPIPARADKPPGAFPAPPRAGDASCDVTLPAGMALPGPIRAHGTALTLGGLELLVDFAPAA